MSEPNPVNILSDDESGHQIDGVSTPFSIYSKRQRTDFNSNPTVFVIDDDPTPSKPSASTSTPSFVPETPMSDLSFFKCTRVVPDPKISGVSGLICLESDNESENLPKIGTSKQIAETLVTYEVENYSKFSATFTESTFSLGNASMTDMCNNSSRHPVYSEYDIPQACDNSGEELDDMQPIDALRPQCKNKDKVNKKKNMDESKGKQKITKKDKILLMEEKKRQKEQEKLQKAALKAEALEVKKLQKEKQKWEKGKFALKSIVAEIDTKVVELGSVGGHLLTRFAEKGVTYRITSNPIERSIVWTMTVPEQLSQLQSSEIVIPYVLLVYEADEFCNVVMNESLMDHVSSVQSHYPTHTVCVLTNRLMAYINKREQAQFRDPTSYSGWIRPPVEEVLSKLTTHFFKVRSRLCIDEAELAEHVVGLTCSLASCQFRKKLTRLSVNANGSLVPKDCVDKTIIKKNVWLKALVAIPKVQPRFAMAIWKRYPTMKSLLIIYMDPSKSVHEKEFLLKDLTTEGLLGEDRRLGEVCSKRVYRILMAQCGNIKTDDVEDGADMFRSQSS